MPDRPLQGVGVLVTRPRAQAAKLVSAIENAGGTAWCLPVLEIAPFEALDIQNSVSHLDRPDIVIFISRNAVEHGIRFTGGAKIAVIGPATARAAAGASAAKSRRSRFRTATQAPWSWPAGSASRPISS